MSKTFTATIALAALLLTGCGHTPVATMASVASLHNSQLPLDTRIARALTPQFPGTLIQVSEIDPTENDPGTFEFDADIQPRDHSALTTLHGQFDTTTGAIRIVDTTTETP